MDSLNVGSLGDMLAAFVGDELRGVAIPTEVPFGPYAGTYQFLMLIYSNEASGESLDLQFYDYETDTIYDISESFEFESDMTLGNAIETVVLNSEFSVALYRMSHSESIWRPSVLQVRTPPK